MRFLQDNTGCFDNETYYKAETAFFCFFTLIIRFLMLIHTKNVKKREAKNSIGQAFYGN